MNTALVKLEGCMAYRYEGLKLVDKAELPTDLVPSHLRQAIEDFRQGVPLYEPSPAELAFERIVRECQSTHPEQKGA